MFCKCKITTLSKKSSIELVGEESQLIFKKPLENFQGKIKVPSLKENSNPILFQDNSQISFSQGYLEIGNQKNKIEGFITQDTQETKAKEKLARLKYILKKGSTLNFNNSEVTEPIEILEKDTQITGTPIFTQPITFTDANAHLKLNINTPLSQDILLNQGMLELENDLKLEKGSTILGGGKIKMNGHRITFSSLSATQRSSTRDPSSFINFISPGTIEFTDNGNLTEPWVFSGDGEKTTVIGNGFTLDVSGGSIEVQTGHTLEMTNIYIKGVGLSGGPIIIDNTANLNFYKTELELLGSYVQASGKINIIGPSCKLIIKANDYWIVDGASSSLNIDGQTLEFEALNNAPIYPPPFLIQNSGSINLLNGGEIFSPSFDLFKGTHYFLLPDSIGETVLTGHVNMSSQTIIIVVNENIAQQKHMTLNGQGFTIKYTLSSPGNIVFQENVVMKSKNLVIEDLDFGKVALEGIGATKAQFCFDDGTVLNILRETVITGFTWPFVGNTEIEGNNNFIEINDSQAITLDNEKTLSIKHCTLKINSLNAIKCLNDLATIKLENCNISLGSSSFTFDKGNLEISGIVRISSQESPLETPTFNFTSKGNLKINSGASLKILGGTTFKYNPNTSGDANANESKRHITMEDPSSKLFLKNCSLDIGNMGLAFDIGNINVSGIVPVKTPNIIGSEFEISSNVKTEIETGASLQIDGEMIYF